MRLYKNRNWLYQKCIIENLSDYEASKIAKCSEAIIARYRSIFGLLRKKILNGKRKIIYQPAILLNTNEVIRAAIAGFNDGDGHIGITKAKRRRSSNYSYGLNVIFSQSRADKMQILYLIQKHYGGFIYIYPRTKRHASFGQLRIGTWQSIKLINDCYPYMTVRKKQAEIAREFIRLKKEKKEFGYKNSTTIEHINLQEECKQRMHWLNRRGTYYTRKYSKEKHQKLLEQMELGI